MKEHQHATENKRASEPAHAAGGGERIRLEHVTITTEIAHAQEIVFDAFSSFARYDLWAPEVQGACHWLLIQAGGVGSRFLAYDKPGRRHLTHEGVVTELERPRRVAWDAPFGEWPRALIGSEIDFQATAHGTRVQETVVFWCASDDRGVLEAFLRLEGLKRQVDTLRPEGQEA